MLNKPKQKILLIGPIPPPAGGVSIHLWRLYSLLKDDFEVGLVDESRNIKPGIFNIRRINFWGYFRHFSKCKLISIHSGLNSLRLINILSGKLLGKKVVLTIHAYPELKRGFGRKFDEFLFGLCDHIISVNNEILGRVSLPGHKTSVQYAFLPPVMKEEKALPVTLIALLDAQKAKGNTIICSNAWRLDRFRDQDLYGVDMCIKAAKSFKEGGYNFHFIFNISTIDMYGQQFNVYKDEIQAAGLENDFSLINEELSFVKLMEKSDIVVRPTNTDGDSLSIREAIYLNKPVISSDVVERPEGTILFKNRDQGDFESKLKYIMGNGKSTVQIAEKFSYDYYHDFYSNLFGKLLKDN